MLPFFIYKALRSGIVKNECPCYTEIGREKEFLTTPERRKLPSEKKFKLFFLSVSLFGMEKGTIYMKDAKIARKRNTIFVGGKSAKEN